MNIRESEPKSESVFEEQAVMMPEVEEDEKEEHLEIKEETMVVADILTYASRKSLISFRLLNNQI